MKNLLNFGITSKTTNWDKVILKNANTFMIAILPIAFIATSFLFYKSLNQYAVLPLIGFIWATSTLLLNRSEKVEISKHVLFLGSIASIAAASFLFTFNLGFEVLLIVLSLVPFVLFNESKIQYTYFGITYLVFISLLFYFDFNTSSTKVFTTTLANSSLAFGIQFLNIFLFQNKISEFKETVDKQNNELNFFNSTLKKKVLERTEALTKKNEELQKLYKDASAYAYIVSHDLKEPLRSITGFTQLIDKRLSNIDDVELKKELLEYSDFVTTGTKRMNALIENVLKYYSIDKEDQLTIENIKLTATFKKLEESLVDIINKNNATFNYVNIPQSIKANNTQIETLFQNLFVNAIKFRSEANPIIKVTCTEHTENYYFVVKDNGVGIGEEFKNMVFEPFKTATSNFDKKGSGIGLSICKRVIEMHNGEIWLESPENGIGTAFHFTIGKNK